MENISTEDPGAPRTRSYKIATFSLLAKRKNVTPILKSEKKMVDLSSKAAANSDIFAQFPK